MTHRAYVWMSLAVVGAVAVVAVAPHLREDRLAFAQSDKAVVLTIASTGAASLAPPIVSVAASPAVISTAVDDALSAENTVTTVVAARAPDAGSTALAGSDRAARPKTPSPVQCGTLESGPAFDPPPALPAMQPLRPQWLTAVNSVVLRTAAVPASVRTEARPPAQRSTGLWTRLLGDDVDAEIKCLALNIYWESRSEPLLGRFAVAAVTLNRVSHKRFPDTVCGVVRQGENLGRDRCQFSWMCDGKSNTPENEAAWREAKHIAHSMLDLDLPDPTNGALWYHADYVTPGWAKAMARITQIGRHLFYRAPVRQARRDAAGLNG